MRADLEKARGETAMYYTRWVAAEHKLEKYEDLFRSVFEIFEELGLLDEYFKDEGL